tara:strand:+ start:1715 stop:1936 length:222 start_codon:yes stop_codon:yes gene_type:complete
MISRVKINMSEKAKAEFNPPVEVDISWHDDGSCTIISDSNNTKNVNDTHKLLGNGKKLSPKHPQINTHRNNVT